ncbi:hypothetical protein DE146DRAFT_734854 [Phaeosphaeria sp. MPI-PUGE-AT-0046c]|nr:hypothetical protein DE146DRAFT_734854 [Phaeosphaeria sp. MPI-PUGE-AT-0046c]
MQLTAITTLLAAAVAVVASPTNLEERQSGGIRATFYNNANRQCSPPESWVEDTHFAQNPVGVCADLGITTPFIETFFNESTTTRTLRFFDRTCANRNQPGTQSIDVAPFRNNDCNVLNIQSWVTI